MRTLQDTLTFIESTLNLALRESHRLHALVLISLGENEGAFKAVEELARDHVDFDERQPVNLRAYQAMQVAAAWCALRPIKSDLDAVWLISPVVTSRHDPRIVVHGMDGMGEQLFATYRIDGMQVKLDKKVHTVERTVQHPLRLFWHSYITQRRRWN